VLPELLRRLTLVLDQIPGDRHEMVFVDDGSQDGSRAFLLEVAAADDRITVVTLSRNFGHQAALTAAMDFVQGDLVVVMDADLQDSPEDIPRLLSALADGCDVAYAIREGRKEVWVLRTLYALAYRLIGALSSTKLPLDAGDFAAMSRRVVDEVRRAPEHNRYLRGLRSWVGFRQVPVKLERQARFAGDSKYSLRALIRLALDGVFAFSITPLRVATVVGACAIGLSVVFSLYAVYARFMHDRSPQGFTALLLMMVFLAGVNLLFLGIIGEYVARIYEEAKARPLYVIDEIVSQARPRSPDRRRQ
jgi:dolichol-phosphate mannosyltransferase